MLAGTVASAMMFAGHQAGAYSYVVGGIFGLSSLGMLATSLGRSGGGPGKAEMMAARREYLRHLATLRQRVRRIADEQRTGMHYRQPDPAQLWSIVDSYRLWERRPADADFAVARVGAGPQTLATPLVPPQTRPYDDLEPLTASALRRFLDTYSVVPGLPVAVSLRSFARVYVRGPRDAALALVRATLAQLTVFHAPDELLIAACIGPECRPDWEYLKWLPHVLHPSQTDALGPARLVATTAKELEELLDGVLTDRPRFGSGDARGAGLAGLAGMAGAQASGPHIVVVVDGGDLAGAERLTADAGIQAVTFVDIAATAPARRAAVGSDPEPPAGVPPQVADRSAIVLTVTADGGLHGLSAGEAGEVGQADGLDLPAATALARQLAPFRRAGAGSGGESALQSDTGLADLLGTERQAWEPRPVRDQLRVPIGVGADGRPVELDLKESALDGMGPHGLLIGATGSGKSELLRTLVLGLAATHDSQSLNFVLIDFKGGATFARMDRLPHTAAVITNLRDQLPLVDRMTDALNGELVRRQELLRRAGNLASLREYEQARASGAALAPLPVLLVICDEFSELLAAKPDFIDLFVQIGRLGRSLGMHLLLASQRLEEGRLRGLDTHLSYRIGLRTFSALESRTVLGVPDAYELPRSPGHGYLKYGTEPLVRFRAAYVSGPYHERGLDRGDSPGAPVRHRVLEYTTYPVAAPAEPAESRRLAPVETTVDGGRETPVDGGRSLLDVMVDRLAGTGVPAHQVWLPPLAGPATLTELLGPLVVDSQRGLCVASPQLRGALQVPVALVDRPFEQRHETLWLALPEAAGHVAIVGGPRSGKSTALRTILCGLSLTHTPREAQIYCLDFGGGSLGALRDLPHVGGVAGRQEAAAVRRTVGEVLGLLSERERHFAISAVDSIGAYRRQGYPDDRYGDVFLVVDGWSTIRSEYDDLEPLITDLATRGLAYGIHLVATAARWMDFRPGLRDLFGSRLEMRLGDPADSLVSRRAASNVPERAPGRGITAESLHFLAALPASEQRTAATSGDGTGSTVADAAGDGTAETVAAVAAAWHGPKAPPVRLLPAVVAYEPPEPSTGGDLCASIGLAEADLGPVWLDFAAEPHFLLFGDGQSGKSSFLRALATSIATRYSPERARLIIVDYRRSLLGAITSEHLIGYGSAAAQTAELVESAAGYLTRRLPGPDVTPQQLRERSWWTGPELFVLVDDYDLVATGPSNPLLPLLEHLAQARDVGLHLVLTRRSGGAARALYEPMIQRLRELSSPGLVLSGDREEGPLLGTVRPRPMPPGRGLLVTRAEGARLVQLAHLPATL
jgi:S-DNA-T family DNA segregation ATPase FtsK/SpoIIIE